MKKQLKWRDAIAQILSQSPEALHYQELTNRIIEAGLRKDLGATPAATVSAQLTSAIRDEGEACQWQKVGRGLYVWKGSSAASGGGPPTDAPVVDSELESQTVISSFGMFWSRQAIEWTASPKILGMQQIGAEPVDFSKQLGIYLLYDGREVIYVGRATDRPLGRRLYEHTLDRLATRWDRFSWFGLLPVSDDGKLGTMAGSFAGSIIIPVLEAVLIEAVEPRQNRKRGDDLAAVEFIQKHDPEIQKKLIKQSLETALSKL
jgi:hypothetical protein